MKANIEGAGISGRRQQPAALLGADVSGVSAGMRERCCRLSLLASGDHY